jgi:transcriptional regulator with XRE-family HTH domain
MTLHEQLKQRRKALGLQQATLQLRIGMNQQQYQRVEAGGNPRLDTLALIARGLDAELVLVPQEKLAAVQAVLAGEGAGPPPTAAPASPHASSDDPWAGLLGQHAG